MRQKGTDMISRELEDPTYRYCHALRPLPRQPARCLACPFCAPLPGLGACRARDRAARIPPWYDFPDTDHGEVRSGSIAQPYGGEAVRKYVVLFTRDGTCQRYRWGHADDT